MEPIHHHGKCILTVCREKGGCGITVPEEFLPEFTSEEVVVVLWHGEHDCIWGRIYERDKYTKTIERGAKSTVYKSEISPRLNGSVHFVIPYELWRDSVTAHCESFREPKGGDGGRLKSRMVMYAGAGDHFELWPWK